MKKIFSKNLFILSLLLLTIYHGALCQQTVGLFLNSPNSYDGFTLFPNPSNKVYLIDNCGKTINEWTVSATGSGTALLLPDGDLLKSIRVNNTDFPAGGGAGILERYSWEGILEWSMEYHDANKLMHHDITVLPNGNILILAWEQKTMEECESVGRVSIPETGMWTETVVEIQPTGAQGFQVIWKWDVWDHLIQDIDENLYPNFGVIADNPHRLNINLSSGSDWLHFNSIDYNEELDQIILSSRSLNEILIIDHSTTTEEASSSSNGNAGKGGDFLFRWGNPINYDRGTVDDQQLFGQHNAQWIPNESPGAGNITIFNNGAGIPLNSQHSSIIEISPELDNFNYELANNTFLPESPIWGFIEVPPTSFYSSRIASTQRLPNGNTLINEGLQGRFFEIDANGVKQWEYICPANIFGPVTQNENPNNNSVFTMRKYPLNYEGFTDKDLSPGQPIELNPIDYICSTSSTENIKENTFEIINPVHQVLSINSSSNKTYTTTIYDLVGNMLHESQATGHARIDVSQIPYGIYLLRIDNSVTKIIISN